VPFFDSNGVRIHYEVFGEGRPLVLAHGFRASLQANWVATGWIETLTPLRQVIAYDARGHGKSGRPSGEAAHAVDEMTDDIVRLMDHLRIEQADVGGYSMGGGTALRALARHPQRFTAGVVGGVGVVQMPPGRRPNVAQRILALDAAELARIEAPVLLVVGQRDWFAHSARRIVEAIPDARLATIPGKTHMSVVPDRRYKDAVAAFLRERPPAP
jgi:pimeloyl-ACP methyl ester carboxylesterase